MPSEHPLANVFPKPGSIPAEFDLPEPIRQTRYICDGKLCEWPGQSRDVVSPICEEGAGGPKQRVIGSYPEQGEEESLEALDAACRAWDNGRGEWPTMSVEDRIRCVEDFTLRMQEYREVVVKLLMWEIGKTLADSRKEFDRTVDYIKDTVAAVKELDRASSRFTIAEGVIGQIRRAPLGVTLCMGPFNYPLNETYTTMIPALIMGNPVVFKPPKLGVLLHRPLLRAFLESFPKGVVNAVYGGGSRIIGPLMKSGKVDVLAFIGTSKVADVIKAQHPKLHRLRCVLGLDAKNPAIVLKDADIDLAVKECALGSLSFNGQRCTAIKMIFVHRSIADRFVEKFSSAVSAMKCGMPWEDGVKITPLPEPGKTAFLQGMIEDARKNGAEVVNPGGGASAATLMKPAVMYPVSREARLWGEEQFGPVVPICPFDDVEMPMNYVIDSAFGQQAAIFGSDPDRIAALIDPLVNQVCRVNVNSQCQRGPDVFPFTGRKDSAEGTLSVSDALRVFTIRTLVAAKESPENKSLITSIVRERKSKFLSTDYLF